MSLRRLVVLLAALACGHALAVPPANDVAPATEAVACRTDADCPHLACGPCTPGTPITNEMLGGPSCAVNPCLDASAVCSVKHRCEIGPRTRKNPAVWKRPPG